MRAVRMVTFEVKDPKNEIKIVRVWNRDIIELATALKKGGYKIIKESIKVSDTIVMGDTVIIKNCA